MAMGQNSDGELGIGLGVTGTRGTPTSVALNSVIDAGPLPKIMAGWSTFLALANTSRSNRRPDSRPTACARICVAIAPLPVHGLLPAVATRR